MLSRLLAVLGDPADVRSIAAIVAGVLITVLDPAHSALVTAVVDGVAGLIVAVDTLTVPARAAGRATPSAPSASTSGVVTPASASGVVTPAPASGVTTT